MSESFATQNAAVPRCGTGSQRKRDKTKYVVQPYEHAYSKSKTTSSCFEEKESEFLRFDVNFFYINAF